MRKVDVQSACLDVRPICHLPPNLRYPVSVRVRDSACSPDTVSSRSLKKGIIEHQNIYTLAVYHHTGIIVY